MSTPEPLTPEEERTLRDERHWESAWWPYRGRERAGTQCATCNRSWPCDAVRLLATLDRERETPPEPDLEGLRELDGVLLFLDNEGRGWKPDALWAFDKVRSYIEGRRAVLHPVSVPEPRAGRPITIRPDVDGEAQRIYDSIRDVVDPRQPDTQEAPE